MVDSVHPKNFVDIPRVLSNLEWALKGGTLYLANTNWTLVWPYGWWRVWLGDVTALAESEHPAKYVTAFADLIFFTNLMYCVPAQDVPTHTQDTSAMELDIAKILSNVSSLLRGRALTVTIDGEERQIRYNVQHKTLVADVPAVAVVDGAVVPAVHSTATPNMSFHELMTILSTGR